MSREGTLFSKTLCSVLLCSIRSTVHIYLSTLWCQIYARVKFLTKRVCTSDVELLFFPLKLSFSLTFFQQDATSLSVLHFKIKLPLRAAVGGLCPVQI